MKLFEKNTLAGIELENRIIRSATHEGLADGNGTPLEALTGLYKRLAKGGAGMIITGYAGVQKSGRPFPTMKVLDCDDQIDGYKKIFSPVRELGTQSNRYDVILVNYDGCNFARSRRNNRGKDTPGGI